MSASADRISGTLFLLFGLVLYFHIIPTYVEVAEGGNLSPDTMPNIIAIVLAVGGAFLVLKPTDHRTENLRVFAVTAAYVFVLASGIYGMSWFGFEYVAPPLAFVIMWMIGERRPAWLVAGVVLMPAFIWFLVIHALGRALP
jgi:putative tricarboxylic transport membrane protein